MSSTAVIEDESSGLTGTEIFLIILKVVIYVFGVFGNLLVIFVVVFLKEYRKTAHWYVLQLSLADILFLQTLPFKISVNIHRTWIYSVWLCKAVQTILFLNYYASILFLTIMAIDRYVAVCHCMSAAAQKWRSSRYSYSVTAVLWVLSVAVCAPVMMYSDIVGIEPDCQCTFNFPKDPEAWCRKNLYSGEGLESCINEIFPTVDKEACAASLSINDTVKTEDYGIDFASGFAEYFPGLDIRDRKYEYENSGDSLTNISSEEPSRYNCIYDGVRPGWNAFIYYNFSVMFLFPLIVITVCYSLIVRRVMNRMGVDRYEATKGQKDREKRDRSRVTLVSALLVLLFTICWLPFHSVHLAKIVGIKTEGRNVCSGLATAISILAYVNSAFNPYLYNFFGKNFRARIRQVRSHRRMRNFLFVASLPRKSFSTTATGAKQETHL